MAVAMRSMLRVAAAAAVAVALGACGALAGTPAPTPTPPIAGGIVGPFAFSYPSSWTVVIAGAPQHYRTVFGFAVSPPATAAESCGPDFLSGLGGCDERVSVPAGTVVVTLSAWVQPTCAPNAQAIVAADVASGWTSLSVDGLAAAFDDTAAAASGFTRTWEIAGPAKGDCNVYEVKAQFGASAADLGPAVDALVASMQFRLPPP